MTEKARRCPQCHREITDLGDSQRFCATCRFPLMRVAGKYELKERLAEGGFGVLYLARHTALHEQARRVVKVFKSELFAQDDGTMHERFLREIRVTAALSEENQHIVRIYDDFGREPGFGHYYVMELLRGETLDARIQREGPLPLELVYDVFYQLCRAMRAAHGKGIIHRDLKPENIFLLRREDVDPFVKVIDFGIAKNLQVTSQSHKTKGAIGTPLYMSPEQCLGKGIDARTDIYAMGIILYEMLMGTPPFVAESAEQLLSVIHAQISMLPPAMAELRPEISIDPGLERVIMQALEKESTDRFPSVEAFWNALLPYAPKGLDLPRFDEQPLDEAFLEALEASQTIPAESVFAVPSDPKEAAQWLGDEQPPDKSFDHSFDHSPNHSPNYSLAAAPIVPSGELLASTGHGHHGVMEPPALDALATRERLAAPSRTAPVLVPFWRRIPVWMWIVGGSLMCCGILLGVWLPMEPAGTKAMSSRVTNQWKKKLGGAPASGARAAAPAPMGQRVRPDHASPADIRAPSPGRFVPAPRPLRLRPQAAKRRSRPIRRRIKRRPRPRKLSHAQRIKALERALEKAQATLLARPSSATQRALIMAHVRLARALEKGGDPNVLRWRYSKLLAVAKSHMDVMRPQDIHSVRPHVARAGYRLAMFAYKHLKRTRVVGTTKRQLRRSARTKNVRYRKAIRQLKRVVKIEYPLWRFCAFVKMADASLHMAATMGSRSLAESCTDCLNVELLHRMLAFRYARPFRRAAKRYLTRAYQHPGLPSGQHPCARRGRALKASLGP